jgi:hypothetical protein
VGTIDFLGRGLEAKSCEMAIAYDVSSSEEGSSFITQRKPLIQIPGKGYDRC